MQLHGGDCFGLQIYDADAMIVRVGDVHLVARNAQASWLAQDRPGQPSVRFAAKKRGARALVRIDDLDFTIVRIGHIQLAPRVSHAKGMLKANLVSGTIHVAELEQALADDRFDLSLAVQRHGANGADFAVSHVEHGAVAGQSARLSKAGFAQRSIVDVFPAIAGVWSQYALIQLERPDLVVSRHGNEERIPMQIKVPRAIQTNAERFPTPTALLSFFTAAGDRPHVMVFQIECSDQMVLAVGHIKRFAL